MQVLETETRPARRPFHRPPRTRRLLFVLFIGLGIAGFQEVVFRLAFPLPEVDGFNRIHYTPLDVFSSEFAQARRRGLANASIRWASEPDGFSFVHHLNLYGFRGRDFAVRPATGVPRVLFVGDSYVEGFGAADQETLPVQFEMAVSQRRPVEAINLGVAAAGLPEYLRLATDAVPLLAPQDLYLVVFANDLPAPPCPAAAPARSFRMNRLWMPRALAALDRLRQEMVLPTRFPRAAVPFVEACPSPRNPLTGKPPPENIDPSILSAMRRGLSNPWNAGCGELHEAALRHDFSQGGGAGPYLERLTALCRGQGTRLTVIYLPHHAAVQARYIKEQNRLGGRGYGGLTSLDHPVYRRQQTHLREATAGLGIPFLDLTEELRDGEAGQGGVFWPVDGHCTAAGYGLIARVLARNYLDGQLPKRPVYADGRPACDRRLEAVDEGPIFLHGHGPGGCDLLGARDAAVLLDQGIFHLTYDGAGPAGWRGCLATSRDLLHWERHGPILPLGLAGEADRSYAGYPLLGSWNGTKYCYYVGARTTTGIPWRVPAIPYTTHAAAAPNLKGPWTAAPRLTAGLELGPAGSFDGLTVTPGPVFAHEGKYWMIYSAAGGSPLLRTLGLASSASPLGPWAKAAAPILPATEQIENAALHYEPASGAWFLFTNHVGIQDGHEQTDAIWVYWSSDPLRWDQRNKAVVLDARNAAWEHPAGNTALIGLPAVLPRGKRLLLLYDGLAGSATGYRRGEGSEHCHRDIAVASLPLPLVPPSADGPWLDPARFSPALALPGGDLGQATPRGTIVIQGEERRRVFMLHPHPGGREARLQFRGRIPNVGLGEQVCSIALHPQAQKQSDGVEFRAAILGEKGKRRELARVWLHPREAAADRGWRDLRLDFSGFEGEEVTVELATHPGPRGDEQYDWALWSFSVLPLRDLAPAGR